MKTIRVGLVFAALVALAGCGVSGPNVSGGGNVTGTWAASLYIQDRQVTSFGMALTQSGSNITGNVLVAQGTYVVENLPISGRTDNTSISLQIGEGTSSEPLIIGGRVGAEGKLIQGTLQLDSPVAVEFEATRAD